MNNSSANLFALNPFTLSVTFMLCEPADISAIFLMTGINFQMLDPSLPGQFFFEGFRIFVGSSSNYLNNAECPGGPYMNITEWAGDWPYGVEVWCPL